MKKFLIAIILAAFAMADISAANAANNIKSSKTTLRQTDTLKRKVYKKHRRVVRRRVSSQKAARMQKQLKQADKHLRDEQKVQKVQRELKKDTLHNN